MLAHSLHNSWYQAIALICSHNPVTWPKVLRSYSTLRTFQPCATKSRGIRKVLWASA